MKIKHLFSALLSGIIFISSISSAFAASEEPIEVLDPLEDQVAVEFVDDEEMPEEEAIKEEPIAKENCSFTVPEEKVYNAEVITVRRKLRVDPGEVFRVKIFIKNTGNMPWFSKDSSCNGPRFTIGTSRDQDRASVFYTESAPNVEDTNWIAENRAGVDQLRTNPGEIASVTFWSKAPEEPDVYKEYFKPVITGVQWIDDAEFYFDVMVGETGASVQELRTRIDYANSSGSVMEVPLEGEKILNVDISEQKLYVKLDDYVIRELPVSSGAAATPTPYGETTIQLKQEVRVGSKPPHYIMPYFMWFRAGGYGFHALPSLGNDGGVFWTEALNHIGIPVSHGCVRLLPEDAEWVFGFAEIGTKVIVQP